MTRRTIIFTDKSTGKMYATPEFNGAKEDFAMAEQTSGKSLDSCDKNWDEIFKEFDSVETLQQFTEACARAQGFYHGFLGDEILPIVPVEDASKITGDEIIHIGAKSVAKTLAQDKPAGCIDVNGKRIDVKQCLAYVKAMRLFTNNGKLFYEFSVTGNESGKPLFDLVFYRDRDFLKLRQVCSAEYLEEAFKACVKDMLKHTSDYGAETEDDCFDNDSIVLDNIQGIIWPVEPEKAQAKGVKITTNYSFKEEYLPPRCRKPKTRDVDGTVNVTIREVTAEEAPVGMITTTYKGDTVYRWYKGKLYTPCVNNKGQNLAIEDVMYMINETGYSYTPEKEDDKIKKVRENASHYLVIDGVLYSESGEPRYNYTTFGLGNNHGGTGFFIETHCNSNLSKSSYFNAFQRDEAIAEFTRVALRRGDTESVKRERKENIKVIIPQAVKLPPTKVQPAQQPAPKITAVGRILNAKGKLAGLVLFDGTQRAQKTLDWCIANADKVSNIKAVRREGVKPYLQGNGISLESLPAITV